MGVFFHIERFVRLVDEVLAEDVVQQQQVLDISGTHVIEVLVAVHDRIVFRNEQLTLREIGGF